MEIMFCLYMFGFTCWIVTYVLQYKKIKELEEDIEYYKHNNDFLGDILDRKYEDNEELYTCLEEKNESLRKVRQASKRKDNLLNKAERRALIFKVMYLMKCVGANMKYNQYRHTTKAELLELVEKLERTIKDNK